MPPVLAKLLSGSFWLALRSPLQAVLALWSVPLTVAAIGPDQFGAYGFAWGFGFLQFLLEFGMSSALQRQVSEAWTRGDRAAVDRAIACGMTFYAAVSAVQVAALLGIAYGALPFTDFRGESYRLVVRLLWLQAATAPCFGLSAVASSVLQAARRYDVVPKFELAIVVLRFLVLVVGLRAGVDYFWVVVAQTAVQVGLSLGPALWVMVRELGVVPGFFGARRADYQALLHISFFMFLIQLSVVLADKIDTTILGFALADPAPAVADYLVVSKPFMQLRQTGWMLAYLVMPAVASLAAARDLAGLERIKYDAPRLHLGAILPVGLLAAIYAGPFLQLWVGAEFPGRVGELAGLMRLFLVAALPLAVAVPVQAAIGLGRIKPIALAALGGSLVNLPISYALTMRLGVAGVIWGTVLTTLASNLLIPGFYAARALGLSPRRFATRSLAAPLAGAAALGAVAIGLRAVLSPWPPPGAGLPTAALPLVAHLAAGSLAYAAGYLAVPAGRGDWATIRARLGRRAG